MANVLRSMDRAAPSSTDRSAIPENWSPASGFGRLRTWTRRLAGLSVVPIPCRGQARSRSGRFTRWPTSSDEFLGSPNASLVVDHFHADCDRQLRGDGDNPHAILEHLCIAAATRLDAAHGPVHVRAALCNEAASTL